MQSKDVFVFTMHVLQDFEHLNIIYEGFLKHSPSEAQIPQFSCSSSHSSALGARLICAMASTTDSDVVVVVVVVVVVAVVKRDLLVVASTGVVV